MMTGYHILLLLASLGVFTAGKLLTTRGIYSEPRIRLVCMSEKELLPMRVDKETCLRLMCNGNANYRQTYFK